MNLLGLYCFAAAFAGIVLVFQGCLMRVPMPCCSMRRPTRFCPPRSFFPDAPASLEPFPQPVEGFLPEPGTSR